jgi:acetyl esterase
MPSWIALLLQGVSAAYLPGSGNTDLADPLLVFEGDAVMQRPLPPFFIPVGTRDPLLDDTRRLARALKSRGVVAQARYYKGEIHAFHATLVSSNARECWSETTAFIDQHLHRRRRGELAQSTRDRCQTRARRDSVRSYMRPFDPSKLVG